MIRTEAEYRKAIEQACAQKERLAEQACRLAEQGLTTEEVDRVLNPIRTLLLSLEATIERYERVRRGEFQEFYDLELLGEQLVEVRVAQGMTQRELAGRLGVSEAQVSRDERNLYHGVSLDRATRVLEALGARVRCVVELDVLEAAERKGVQPEPESRAAIRIAAPEVYAMAASFRPPAEDQVLHKGAETDALP